jgi:prepilin-type N-terminal cleavage/methylation domain-containing protein
MAIRLKNIRVVPRRKGFTLVEMLLVAALVVIFSSIAIINVSEYMKSGRSKAAVAEARHIATAMSFAQQDLGFFPKICFLNFGLRVLEDNVRGMGYDAVEYHGNPLGDLEGRLKRQWRGGYMGINHEKVGKMQFTSNGIMKGFDWPLDPWGTPYTAYLVQSTTERDADGKTRVSFVDGGGAEADYFAGVVSYGPNKVPGLAEAPDLNALNARK